jgi:hypothetical protein
MGTEYASGVPHVRTLLLAPCRLKLFAHEPADRKASQLRGL